MTIVATTANAGGENVKLLLHIKEAAPLSATSTKVTLHHVGSNHDLVFTGIGFSGGSFAGGTITGLQIKDSVSGTVQMTFTALNIDGTAFDNAIALAQGGDSSALDQLLYQADSFSMTGGTGIDGLQGGDQADIIKGGGGGDSLFGDDGDDTLIGGAGGDQLDGGAGNDTASYVGAAAAVTVNLATGSGIGGDAAGDTFNSIENVVGGNAGDTIVGNDLANIVEGGKGADTLDGGLGLDTLSYAGALTNVTVTLGAAGAESTGIGGDAQGDKFSNFENILGGKGNDSLTGNELANVIDGGNGNDAIDGGMEADTLSGGLGNDAIKGGDGADTIDGGGGNDLVEGGAGGDILEGGDGFDTMSYANSSAAVQIGVTAGGTLFSAIGGDAQGDVASGFEKFIGSELSDLMMGGLNSSFRFNGGGGNDSLTGGSLDDTLDGGTGNDTLTGREGADILIGGDGNDTASYSQALSGVTIALGANGAQSVGKGGDAQGDKISLVESIIGTYGDDVLTGNNLNNSILGSKGNDRLAGGAGHDQLDGGEHNDGLDGGAGNDVLFGGDGDDVLTGGAGNDEISAGGGTDTASYAGASAAVTVDLADNGAFSVATGGDAQGDRLSGVENLIGGNGADKLTGNNLDNAIEGGKGADILSGDGAVLGGVDTLTYQGSSAAVTVTLGVGGAETTGTGGDAQGDKLKNFENIVGGKFNDKLTGNDLVNAIQGGAGNDIIGGGDDADTLDGGEGNDIVEGGAGADVLAGGAGIDTLSYANSTSGVLVWLDANGGLVSAMGGDAAGDTASGFESILGSSKNDNLFGNDFVNTINGGDGDDLVNGGGGADILSGGNGSDTVSYALDAAGVSVALGNTGATTVGKGGEAEGDKIAGFEKLAGGFGADVLTGNKLDNTLNGKDGNDLLAGLGGADILEGDAGLDTASYAASGKAVTVDLFANTGAGGDAAGDSFISIENLVGSNAADTLTGDVNANAIDGGKGADVLDGQGGIDLLSYANAIAAVTVTLGNAGVETTGIAGDAQGDKLKNFENIFGGKGADKLTGNDDVNDIQGGDGNDTIDGGLGNDILGGGLGNDTIKGGAGKDTIDGGLGNDAIEGGADADVLNGGDGIDTASYAGSAVGVTVQLNVVGAIGQAKGGDAQGDTGSGLENLLGSSQNDELFGNALVNAIDGGDGDDIIGGNDGADVLVGGKGNDTASYTSDGTGVTVTLAANGAQSIGKGGHAEGDKISGIENLTGGLGADILTGNSFDNTITGNKGNDLLAGLGGADTLIGGDGIDTASYAASAKAVTVDLSTGAGIGGDAAGDALAQIENLIGSKGADTLTGDGNANVIAGGKGADAMDGGAGSDTLDYSSSSAAVTITLGANGDEATGVGGDAAGDKFKNFESVIGTKAIDKLTGNTLDNTIEGGAAADVMDGGDGADTLSYASSSAAVTITLGKNGDEIIGIGGDAAGDKFKNFENVTGGNGDDILIGTTADNVFEGSAGNDLMEGGAGADKFIGGAGNDTLNYANSSAAVAVALDSNGKVLTATGGDAEGDTGTGIESIIGTAGDDQLFAHFGNNVLDAGAGNDLVDGGANADVLLGGDGIDTLSYAMAPLGVMVALGTDGALSIGKDGYAEGDEISGFENLGGGDGNDVLTGNNLDNVIDGGAGNDALAGLEGADTLAGGLGNDTLTGGAGADTLQGGDGSDTASYAASAAAVTIDLNNAVFKGGDAEGDTLSGIENIVGGAGNDTLTGDVFDNVIEGGDGADIMIGGDGIDTVSYASSVSNVTVALGNGDVFTLATGGDLVKGFENIIGGAGNDWLAGNNLDNVIEGGKGADILDGSGGIDTVSYASSTSTVTVVLSDNPLNTQGVGGDAASDAIWNMENIIGGQAADKLGGNMFDNVIEGGKGADILDGGAGIDTVSYAGSFTYVSLQLGDGDAATTGQFGDAQGDTVSNFENITGSQADDNLRGNTGDNVIDGGAGNDAIAGYDGADTLRGGAGNDNLTGRIGADTLTGGDGSDKFTYYGIEDQGDHIADFTVGQDKVAIVFEAFGIDDPSTVQFVAGGAPAASTGDATFLYDTDDGALYFDADGNGAGAAELLVTLDGLPAFTFNDILLS